MTARKPDPRPDHWFITRTRSLLHRKAADGDYAVCSKRITPRSAPHEETGEWGVWYETDEQAARWSHVLKTCPECRQAG